MKTWTKALFVLILGFVLLLSGEARRVEANPPVGGKYYYIQSVWSGKYLDLEYVSTADGVRVAQWDYWGGLSQQWKLAGLGNGFYKLQNRYSGKVMDVPGWSVDNGTPIQQYQSLYLQENQQFTLVPVHTVGNVFSIRNRYSGKALDVLDTHNGTVIKQFDPYWSPSQQWLFIEVPGQTGPTSGL